MTSLVTLVWRDAMALIDAANVGSHARLYQKKNDNVLYTLDLFVRNWGASVIFDRLLHLGAVLNELRLVQGMLRLFWIGVLVLSSLSLDVARDGQVNMPHVIIPVEGDATKLLSLPVNSHFVVFFQCFLQIFGVLDSLALHSKIIAEHDGAPHVALEARGELTLVVAVLAELLLEELVGQDACFRKSIHADINFEIDILVVENAVQVVFFDNLIR